VGILPTPQIGFLGCLDQFAIVFFHVDQGDVAIVFFRFFIQQFEDALGSSQRHHHRVELLGDLVDRHGKAPAQLQEGSNGPQGQTAESADGHGSPGNGDEHVLQVAQVADDRPENVGEFIGFCGIVAQVRVDLVELLLILLFMAEDLDHFLPIDHLFDEAVDGPQRSLLFDEILCGFTADVFADDQHHGQDHQHQQGQRNAGDQHGNEHGHDGYDRREHHRDALRDHLPQ